MKEMMKNSGILFAITLIAGLVLGLTYQGTKDTITLRQEEDKKAAYREVFTDAENFIEIADFMTEDNRQTLDAAGYEMESIDEIWQAVDKSGNSLGYVFAITTKEGYGGDIRFAAGIRNDGTVNGISILDINETAGLGMNAEKVLKPQFEGKAARSFVYTKTGAVSDGEIDAISGATITTNAFVNGINCALTYFYDVMGGGSVE